MKRGGFYSAFIIKTKHMETETLIRESRWFYLKAIFYNMDCFFIYVCVCVDSSAAGSTFGRLRLWSGRQGDRESSSSHIRQTTTISTAAPKHAGYLGSLRIDLRLKRRMQSQEGWQPKNLQAQLKAWWCWWVCLCHWFTLFFSNNVKTCDCYRERRRTLRPSCHQSRVQCSASATRRCCDAMGWLDGTHTEGKKEKKVIFSHAFTLYLCLFF